MKLLAFCAASLLTVGCFAAETNDKIIVNELIKHWQSSKDLTLAVANAMPDDAYSFKATDAEMSFGGQMNHIAAGDNQYCSLATGQKPSEEKPADDTKATAVKNLTTQFDYCLAGLEKMTDADLQKAITMRGRTTTPFELFWGGFTHTAHHRGQAEVYLRLKGITPPGYKF